MIVEVAGNLSHITICYSEPFKFKDGSNIKKFIKEYYFSLNKK